MHSKTINLVELLADSANKTIGKLKPFDELSSVEWARLTGDFYMRLHELCPNDSDLRTRLFISGITAIRCPFDLVQLVLVVQTAEAVLHADHE